MLRARRLLPNSLWLTPSCSTQPIHPPPQLLVSSPLRRQRIKPEAKLTRLLTPIRPKDTTLEPLLDARDSLPGGRVAYRLVLTYAFSVSEAGKFTAALPLTNGSVRDRKSVV